MSINIYDEKYNEKEFISEDGILEYVSDYDIFNHYIDNLIVGGVTNSPLRKKDENPSFGVFWSKKYNKLLFKDMATGDKGDCFFLVSRMFAINKSGALNQIASDFRIDDKFIESKSEYKLVSKKNGVIHTKTEIESKVKESISIAVRTRDWSILDRNFWRQYGISKKTLERYNVKPISFIFINNQVIKADNIAYCFTEEKDGVVRYKIYQPFSKKIKWLNNFNDGTLSGFAQLPEKGDLLIITSSLKDGMCLYDLGYDFIAPQAETTALKPHVIGDLKNRFKEIVVFFDNDKAGITAAKKHRDSFGFNFITTNDIFEKDPSDYYKKYGGSDLLKLIK